MEEIFNIDQRTNGFNQYLFESTPTKIIISEYSAVSTLVGDDEGLIFSANSETTTLAYILGYTDPYGSQNQAFGIYLLSDDNQNGIIIPLPSVTPLDPNILFDGIIEIISNNLQISGKIYNKISQEIYWEGTESVQTTSEYFMGFVVSVTKQDIGQWISVKIVQTDDLLTPLNTLGGFVGLQNNTIIQDCYVKNITHSSSAPSNNTGGLVGSGQYMMNRCYTDGTSLYGEIAGGLVGFSEPNLEDEIIDEDIFNFDMLSEENKAYLEGMYGQLHIYDYFKYGDQECVVCYGDYPYDGLTVIARDSTNDWKSIPCTWGLEHVIMEDTWIEWYYMTQQSYSFYGYENYIDLLIFRSGVIDKYRWVKGTFLFDHMDFNIASPWDPDEILPHYRIVGSGDLAKCFVIDNDIYEFYRILDYGPDATRKNWLYKNNTLIADATEEIRTIFKKGSYQIGQVIK